MVLLLTGGSASGKSTYAEALLARQPAPRYLIAAMRPYGADSLKKIQAHRARHEKMGVQTIERFDDLAGLRLPARGAVVLECLCHLLDHELFDAQGREKAGAVERILDGLDALAAQCEPLILVTNEVGSGGTAYDPGTRAYIEALGRLNRAAAARSDTVIEVVAGLPQLRKGVLPQRPAHTGGKDMLLILGGAGAGKRVYAERLGFFNFADGVLDDRPALDNLQDLVARDPEGIEEMLPQLLKKRVVICDEVGSGIIPATPEERRVRGQTGRLCARLAAEADTVVRLVCGIPTALKGTLP